MAITANRWQTTLSVPVDIPYLLYLPNGVEARGDWPLVLFLHGSAERGDDAEVLRRQGLPKVLDGGLALPAVVLAPQCPPGQVWAQQHRALSALLDRLVPTLPVDPTKVTLTGLSLGGAGVVHYAASEPDRFRALAPICGPWTWYYMTPEIAHKPLWIVHGEADELVSVEDSKRLAQVARALGGRPQLTLYPGVGHHAWELAYADPAFTTWLVDPR
jgi:predicted peptidase